MCDDGSTKTTVRVTEQFEAELEETYPAATSLPQALCMAAQDGVDFRQAIEADLETYINDRVAAEVNDEPTTLRADD